MYHFSLAIPRMPWPVGQAVKTPASHAGNGGSIPPRVTILFPYIVGLLLFPKLSIEHFRVLYISVGVYDSEVPPVPFPNTAVKLICAHDTRAATPR